MYSRSFWDKFYREHFNDAPWMQPESNNSYFQVIRKYLGKDLKNKSILDYGCGNGRTTYGLIDYGAQIDYVEISTILFESLKKSYDNNDKVNVFLADNPSDFFQKHPEKKYDVIIAWALMHHIDREHRKEFCDAFVNMMKKGSVLLIGGWDSTDSLFENGVSLSSYTNMAMWSIDDLINCFGDNELEIVNNDVIDLGHEWNEFHPHLKFRCLMYRKIV